VVRTNPKSIRALLASLGLGATLIAGAAGILDAAGGFSATAADTGSSATGVRITGAESTGADSGSVSTASGGISASGITTHTADGYAEATVASIQIGMTTIGPISARCSNGATTVNHGAAPAARNLKISWGTGGGTSVTAATITITGAKGQATTITAAHVSCGKASVPTAKPPTSVPGSSGPITGQTGAPGAPTSAAGSRATGAHRSPVSDSPAPAPQPKTGHIAVTG
jgi:hypothetical protein